MKKVILSCTFATIVSLFAPTADAASLTIFASGARNVSDYAEADNGMGGFIIVKDGLGDQVATSPYPYLSAGINMSGASGQNGTARFQLEFDLSGITAPIASAFLVLNAAPPQPYHLLPTSFFHVTGDEEGTITASDFQSPAVDTGIVQNPGVAAGAYFYDVTSFVSQDVLDGFAYSSFQGRVSDELASNLFRQGIEYYSLALDPSTNDDPALRPRLVVNLVPEPGTVGLMGIAAVVLAGARIRRRQSIE